MNYNGSVIQDITVDVSQVNAFAPLLVKQGDAYTRLYKVTITDNGTPIQIQNATVTFNCENQTDPTLKASVPGTVNNDGTVTVEVPQVVMQKSGYIKADISITTNDNNEAHVLKTMTFILDCQKSANPDGTSTTAEDDILAEIAAGTLAPPGRKVTILDYATSVAMDFEVPSTYEGKIGDIVVLTINEFNNRVGGTIWQLRSTQVVGGTTYYFWQQLADAADLEDKEDVANKTNAITDSNKSSTTLYPSNKAMADYVSQNSAVEKLNAVWTTVNNEPSFTLNITAEELYNKLLNAVVFVSGDYNNSDENSDVFGIQSCYISSGRKYIIEGESDYQYYFNGRSTVGYFSSNISNSYKFKTNYLSGSSLVVFNVEAGY